ncbi:hypothetical protein LCGC14_3028430 [marine sediment metagenome]|uniref:Uncharacterized protein n=1 Tax=marine sediment metagenome TaxID=412755 RepID=A0A0F8ZJ95_9ZZZZ
MPRATESQMKRARQARMVGIVMAATMILWLGAQVLVGRIGPGGPGASLNLQR